MPFTASDICKIILAVILPPVGVFLERGCGADFFINILLTILGKLNCSTDTMNKANNSRLPPWYHPRSVHYSEVLSESSLQFSDRNRLHERA